MKKFLLNTAILLLVGASIAHATIFTTNGDGTVYSFEKLSTVSGSGVTKDGSLYVLYQNLLPSVSLCLNEEYNCRKPSNQLLLYLLQH